MKGVWQYVFQIAMGVGVASYAFQRKPIAKGPRNPEPFPNQKFARAMFFIVGAALILGAFWSLWLARHAGP